MFRKNNLFLKFISLSAVILTGFLFFCPSIAKAEILYQEDFNSGQADGWYETASEIPDWREPIWQTVDGKYYIKITGRSLGGTSIYQNGFSWDNFVFSFDAELNDGVDRTIHFRRQDDENKYTLGLRGFWSWASDDTPVIYLAKCYNGVCEGSKYWSYFAAYHFDDSGALNNETAHIDIEAFGNRIRIFYNSQLVIDWQETTEDYPKSGTIGFSGWSGHYGAVDVGWDNVAVISGWPEEPTEPDPVIIVPGIMGSWNVSGEWELDPILHTYDNLWEALKLAGYKDDQDDPDNQTLFAFPYQWRLSNSYTAVLLQDKIQEVKDICECEKVDLVAHSMGGLVARAYIQSNDYQDDVDQLIFLGTPHQGSTKAYLTWEGGELGIDKADFIMERIFTLEAIFNGYGSIFKYVRGLPMQSVQELLPIYNYLRDKETMLLREYSNNYPVNTFLELLNNQSQLDKLNSVNITNILANAGADSTINNLRVVDKQFIDGRWEHGYPEHYSLPFTDHGLEYGVGDGTVPERSNKDFLGLENVIINSDHDDMVTDAQKIVIKELTGIEPTEEIRKNIFSKFLLIRIFSPADFTVIDPDGKKIGKNINDSEIIQGAFYSGFDNDIEFAVIPDPMDGEYKIELEGTGYGEYKLSASFIDDEHSIDSNYSGVIQTEEEHNFTLNCQPGAEEPIENIESAEFYGATIESSILDIEDIYSKGQLVKKGDAKSLINQLKKLDKKLKYFDKKLDKLETRISRIENSSKIKIKAKQRILENFNKQLEKIIKDRQKSINKILDLLEKRLNKIKEKNRINQDGYDIIIDNINYLKNNL